MKVIILAAGVGSRLDATGYHPPKPLTKLSNGKSILQLQLETLAPYVSLDNIIIVVGYKKEMIMEKFPHLLYVYNPSFASENTSKSLLRALKKVEDDLLWLNGDVIFRPSILASVLQNARTGMIVNQTENLGEEEVKYRADETGRILEVSKGVKEAQGEALGINFYKKSDLSLLKSNLEQCQALDYFEKGIEWSIQQGQQVWSIPVGVTDCVEVDFAEDLIKANEILQIW